MTFEDIEVKKLNKQMFNVVLAVTQNIDFSSTGVRNLKLSKKEKKGSEKPLVTRPFCLFMTMT